MDLDHLRQDLDNLRQDPENKLFCLPYILPFFVHMFWCIEYEICMQSYLNFSLFSFCNNVIVNFGITLLGILTTNELVTDLNLLINIHIYCPGLCAKIQTYLQVNLAISSIPFYIY